MLAETDSQMQVLGINKITHAIASVGVGGTKFAIPLMLFVCFANMRIVSPLFSFPLNRV